MGAAAEADDKDVLMLDKCQPPPVTPAKTPECIVVQVRVTRERSDLRKNFVFISPANFPRNLLRQRR